MSILKTLSDRHNDWLRMAHSVGAGSYAEDVVQEMYLKIYNCSTSFDKIAPDGIVNPWYIYRAILSITRDIQRVQSKVVKVSLTEVWDLLQNHSLEDYDEDFDRQMEEAVKAVNSELERWHWYDRLAVEVCYKHGATVAHVARETGISENSLYYTIRNGKKKLKEAVREGGN